MIAPIPCRLWTLAPLLLAFTVAGGCGESPTPETADAVEGTLPSGPATYIELLGTDTTALERFERTDDRLQGTIVDRNPETRVISYAAELGPDGTVANLAGEVRTPETNPEGEEPWTFDVRMEGDSVRIVTVSEPADTSRTTVEAGAGTIPSPPRIPMPPAVIELAAARFAQSGADTLELGFLQPPSGRIFPSAAYRRGGDTIAVIAFGSPLVVRLSDEGRLLAVDGSETTTNIRVEPAAGSPNVLAMADSFAARDARGEGIGTPSPTATVEETVAGATLRIEYSRPAMRGREIWGGLVPWNEVWRTGANAATVLTTDRELLLGEGVELPAGSYTLWSTYTPEQATLIVNSETGQWGTQYDESADFARVPMETSPTEEPLERFTISVEPTDGGGRLVLAWDGRRHAVPFSVR